MLAVKKLLCPTDFSEFSFKALRVANVLAKQFSAELVLLHVITPMPTYAAPGFEAGGAVSSQFNIAEYLKEVEASARRSLDRSLKEQVDDSLNAHSEILHGDAADSIVSFAGKESVDVIIIATHGYTGFRRFIHGSVAEKVVRLSPVPVLVVPAGEGND